jgi:multidrug resistance efflux pump
MAKEYAYNELKESKLIYERKLPAFGIIITLLMLIFVVASVMWAAFSVKTYIVKATGICVSENKVNLMNRVGGAIKSINITEGGEVSAGDVLIEFDSFQTELQIAKLEADLSFYTNKKDILDRLIIFINNLSLSKPETRVNPFDNSKTSEMAAYSNAQTFLDYINGQEKQAQDEEREYAQSEVDSLKTQFLSQQYTSLDELIGQCQQKESEIKVYQDSLAEYKVVAEIDGVVHLSQGLTLGTVIQAGSLLGSISSPDPDSLYFQSVINAQDRAKINVGDPLEIAVAGLPQNEFGVIKGKVVAIDIDSTQTENGEVYYTVKIKPEKTTLQNGSGDKIELTSGMLGESRIKYDETTWLKWAIEQIGVKFR